MSLVKGLRFQKESIEISKKFVVLNFSTFSCFQLGILSYFPGVAVVLVFLLMLRVHRIRLLRFVVPLLVRIPVFRIYQNRKNVDTFIAVRSNFVVQQHKV